ncbi:MAG TPA: polyhydroxyalkanoate depolymerase [Casimicrobiaceae bacterium]
MLYQAYQAHEDALQPFRFLAKSALPALNLAVDAPTGELGIRELAAACEVFAVAALTHQRPPFRIDTVTCYGCDVAVHEEVVYRTPFGTLLHFRKEIPEPGPRVLIVAPMSGHFATLLRETARTMLGDHDVYVTDWHNARDTPLTDGRFGFDEYIEHVIDFLSHIGPSAHLMAICQPCVAALAAVALMSEDDHPATPLTMTLMAGPIDCRIAPTQVNKLANNHTIDWFERNLIGTVPLRHAGAMRRVYPGFLQLAAFMNMNLERHITAFRGLYADLVNGEKERADATRKFYEEYFAVADLPAEFFLETVQHVFQDHALPCGKLKFRGYAINPGAIRRVALLTIEGERDDICSLGQTLAAHDLCTGMRPYMRSHYVQAGVGHYGVFSGKRWSNLIYPLVRETIHTHT